MYIEDRHKTRIRFDYDLVLINLVRAFLLMR